MSNKLIESMGYEFRETQFILKEGVPKIWKKEQILLAGLLGGLKKIPGLKIYGSTKAKERVPVVSFNLKSLHPGHLSYLLDEVYDIAVRSGLHCAPHAHRTLGTFPYGTVRVSLGFYNSEKDIDILLKALSEIAQRKV